MRDCWSRQRGLVQQDSLCSGKQLTVQAVQLLKPQFQETELVDLEPFQQWLFGVEITDTAIIFCDKMVVFVASPKKIAFFKQIENGKENDHLPKYVFVNREKTDADKKFLKEAIDHIKKSGSVSWRPHLSNLKDTEWTLSGLGFSFQGSKIGVFLKDKYDGEFFQDWTKAIDQAGFDKVDAGVLMSNVLAVKDEAELNNIKKAAEITNRIFSKQLKDQIINIIDGEKVRLRLVSVRS